MIIVKRQWAARNLEVKVRDYFDVVGTWLRRPISKKDENWLRARCGPGGLYVEDAPVRMRDRGYRQRLVLYQPSREAREKLTQFGSVLITYVEVTRDLILPDEVGAFALVDLFNRSFVQHRHGRMKPVGYREGGSTRQPPKRGERRSGRWFHWYGDRPCKLTGDANCFHFEGRHQGVRYVRRIGIHTPDDLLNFDFARYFAKHVTLYEIDVERLGRYHENKRTGQKRKRPHVRQYGSFVYNFDRRRGGTLYHVRSVNPDGMSRSLQRFVDVCGRGPYLKRLKLPPSLYMFMGANASHLNKPFPSFTNSRSNDVFRETPSSFPFIQTQTGTDHATDKGNRTVLTDTDP